MTRGCWASYCRETSSSRERREARLESVRVCVTVLKYRPDNKVKRCQKGQQVGEVLEVAGARASQAPWTHLAHFLCQGNQAPVQAQTEQAQLDTGLWTTPTPPQSQTPVSLFEEGCNLNWRCWGIAVKTATQAQPNLRWTPSALPSLFAGLVPLFDHLVLLQYYSQPTPTTCGRAKPTPSVFPIYTTQTSDLQKPCINQK